MKKLLIVLLVLVSGAVFAPQAEAGQYAKIWNGHCYTYVPKSQVYGNDYYRTSRSRSTYYQRPVRRYYSEPVRSYRSYDYCDRPVRTYSSRPRFAISFGF